MLHARLPLAAMLLLVVACNSSQSLSPEEAMVIGKWECNTRNGAIWLYAFSRNHKLTIRDVGGSRAASYGTWHVDGSDVVCITDRDQTGPTEPRTDRIPLAELEQAARAGTDPNARWQRL